MWPNPQETTDFVTYTKEILNGKLYFFVQCIYNRASQKLYAFARIAPYINIPKRKKIIKSFVTSQFGYYNGIRTHNYLVRKRTRKHLAKNYIHDLYMKELNISRIANNDNFVSMHVRKL